MRLANRHAVRYSFVGRFLRPQWQAGLIVVSNHSLRVGSRLRIGLRAEAEIGDITIGDEIKQCRCRRSLRRCLSVSGR